MVVASPLRSDTSHNLLLRLPIRLPIASASCLHIPSCGRWGSPERRVLWGYHGLVSLLLGCAHVCKMMGCGSGAGVALPLCKHTLPFCTEDTCLASLKHGLNLLWVRFAGPHDIHLRRRCLPAREVGTTWPAPRTGLCVASRRLCHSACGRACVAHASAKQLALMNGVAAICNPHAPTTLLDNLGMLCRNMLAKEHGFRAPLRSQPQICLICSLPSHACPPLVLLSFTSTPH